MKTIIAGSRDILNYRHVRTLIERSGIDITEVVSGCARGVDRLGERWAEENGVPVRRFSADWDRYGRRAGYVRNEQMAQYADAAIIVWDGRSRGTRQMLDLAKALGLEVRAYRRRR